ncbi:MAG: nucleotidyltransferase domain-containing protein [Acidobacteriota bacterium]
MALSVDWDQQQALGALKERMERLLGDDLVFLRVFGSRARGDAEADSDLDVALVARNLDSGRRREILDEVAEIELEWLAPLSLILLSEEDFLDLRNRERRIALDIVREGVEL